MTVAVLNDIHGNLRALEAVLAEPDVQRAEIVVIGGDSVPGPHAAEVVRTLRLLGSRVRMVRGNGEREVCDSLLTRDAAGDSVNAWVKRRLDVRDLPRLRGAPIAIELGGAIYCHSTPTIDDVFFTASTTEVEVADIVRPVSRGLLMVAHTHTQFDRTVGELRIVNAGSVGLTCDGSPGARWALVDGPQVHLRTTSYDHEAEADAWDVSGFPNVEQWSSWLRSPPSTEASAAHIDCIHTSR